MKKHTGYYVYAIILLLLQGFFLYLTVMSDIAEWLKVLIIIIILCISAKEKI